MRLQHISIARNPQTEDTTRAFYGDLLGLQELPVPTSIAHLNLIWFQVGSDAEIHILVEESTKQATGRHFCLVVDDVQHIRKLIDTAGYETWDVEKISGRPRFFCFDPSHNIIEIATIEDDYLKYQEK